MFIVKTNKYKCLEGKIKFYQIETDSDLGSTKIESKLWPRSLTWTGLNCPTATPICKYAMISTNHCSVKKWYGSGLPCISFLPSSYPLTDYLIKIQIFPTWFKCFRNIKFPMKQTHETKPEMLKMSETQVQLSSCIFKDGRTTRSCIRTLIRPTSIQPRKKQTPGNLQYCFHNIQVPATNLASLYEKQGSEFIPHWGFETANYKRCCHPKGHKSWWFSLFHRVTPISNFLFSLQWCNLC